jgi:hypothetical protein
VGSEAFSVPNRLNLGHFFHKLMAMAQSYALTEKMRFKYGNFRKKHLAIYEFKVVM